ncbi:MarR family winged helix-turn-helix transcriptional regulator [Aeromicrobium sp. CFBP 8757]|uniref:MarR family winged helix-turn-helix transcriptional regulator n=1 Tax=Aeromicrobium sp. CFBP 8757 TaxID=2775288 RepID=UPI0035301DA7
MLDSTLQRSSGLSHVEYYVLAGLSDQPSRSMRMGQLAQFANSQPSRLSHVTARLEKRGLVRRESDLSDGRSTWAVLTDAGHDALVAAAPGHVDQVRRLVFDTLTAREQHAMRDAAAAILAKIDAAPHGDQPG